MRKRYILACLLAGLAMPPPLPAATYPQVWTVGTGGDHAGFGPYQTGQAGEFTFETDTGWILNHYSAYTTGIADDHSGAGSFQTFCVEGTEDLYAGQHDAVTFSQQSMYNGTGSTGGGVTLTLGAAWLYYEFATGQLDGYNYTDTSGRHASAGALQNAIWYYMGQPVGGPYDANNHFMYLANNKFGASGAFDPNSGQYPVDVLNLWYVPAGAVGTVAGARQDQLVLVPDGGVTAMLLGMGFLAVCWVRRMVMQRGAT